MKSFKQFITEASSRSDINFRKAGSADNKGSIISIDGSNEGIRELAKFLNIPDSWKLTRLKTGGYAAYDRGERLVFFSDADDYGDVG